jgi:hypothetical protein
MSGFALLAFCHRTVTRKIANVHRDDAEAAMAKAFDGRRVQARRKKGITC